MNCSIVRCITLSVVGCASVLMTVEGNAAVNVYTNRALWEAAVGPLSGTETFNSFGVDTSYQNVAVALNNMSVTGTVGVNGPVTQKIDAPPHEFVGFYSWDGTAQLLGDLDGINQFIRFNFATPVVSWGVDTVGIADVPRTTNFNIYSASNVLLGSIPATSPSDNQTKQFYGFDLTTGSASYVIVQNTSDGSNDVFSFDNISFVIVPEPTGLLLAGVAILAFGKFGRRGRTQRPQRAR